MDDLQGKRNLAESMECDLIQAHNALRDCRDRSRGLSSELAEWLSNTANRTDKAIKMVQKYINNHKTGIAEKADPADEEDWWCYFCHVGGNWGDNCRCCGRGYDHHENIKGRKAALPAKEAT